MASFYQGHPDGELDWSFNVITMARCHQAMLGIGALLWRSQNLLPSPGLSETLAVPGQASGVFYGRSWLGSQPLFAHKWAPAFLLVQNHVAIS
jgi:hypothetical protein